MTRRRWATVLGAAVVATAATLALSGDGGDDQPQGATAPSSATTTAASGDGPATSETATGGSTTPAPGATATGSTAAPPGTPLPGTAAPPGTPAPGPPGPGPTPTSPPPAPAPPPAGALPRGTWALQQVTSSEQLARLRPILDDALSTPGVVGLSLRVPWTAVDGNLAVLDDGLAVARAHGVAFSARFMAGRHSPARVLDAGPTYTVDGARVPAPFGPDGSPNAAFEAAYGDAVAALATWSRANGAPLLHLPWYGQDWAELNHGREVRAAPGYSYEAWLAAHRRLVDVAVARAGGPGLVLEWPLSGYGPLWPAAGDLADHLVGAFASNPGGVVVQANGWDHDGVWGAPDQSIEQQMDAAFTRPLTRAFQSIQPTATRWQESYGVARAKGARYVEVYADSFRTGAPTELEAEVQPGAV